MTENGGGHALQCHLALSRNRPVKRLDTYIGEGVLDDSALAGYLATLFAEGRAPAVAGQVAAAVRLRAKLHGETSPVGPATDRVLAGFRREGRHRGRGQVGGVTWAQADAASALATGDTLTLAGLRDAAIVPLASDAMLRVCEIAAIDVADFTHLEDGAGLLKIRASKTDQEGRGAVAFLGAPTMRRVRAWTDAAGHTTGALFPRVRRNNVVGDEHISARAVRTIIAKRAADAGVDGRISGHSLGVGAAQSLAAAGASVVEMQIAGRWESVTMPGRYASGQLAACGAVAKFRYCRA